MRGAEGFAGLQVLLPAPALAAAAASSAAKLPPLPEALLPLPLPAAPAALFIRPIEGGGGRPVPTSGLRTAPSPLPPVSYPCALLLPLPAACSSPPLLFLLTAP
jgi:hypothetical protein